jgi:biotin carboxyl carrier protein
VNLFVHGEQLRICLSDVATQAAARAASAAAAAVGARQLSVVSPMPGKIVQVFVSPGQQVRMRRPLAAHNRATH